ncbi:MAG: hypothetical protein U9R25_11970 [Chloroflexota bacterium]|nr:hypothetical protein [Chloroflexota bacterium]
MAIFQHPLWGFELTYPDDWTHQSNVGADGFAKNAEAFGQTDVANGQAAHLLVRGEWNGRREPIAPLWNQHITKLSIMLGAKKLGSSPFSMGGANGFEAEIQMPQRQNRRLWAGILAREAVILHFMVSHPREERTDFEPQATQIIASLRFLDHINDLTINERGLPLPPDYAPVPPASLVPDAPNDDSWQAYDGSSDIGALQAFYYRELPHYGWEISEFIPFPNQVDIHFARLRICKEDIVATLGIIPTAEKKAMGKIVVKYE